MTRKGSQVQVLYGPPLYGPPLCSNSAVLSHFGPGTCVSLLGPASVVLSQWPRDICRARSSQWSRDICGTSELSGVCQPSPPRARGSCLPRNGTSGLVK
jgi:hypothetical protein